MISVIGILCDLATRSLAAAEGLLVLNCALWTGSPRFARPSAVYAMSTDTVEDVDADVSEADTEADTEESTEPEGADEEVAEQKEKSKKKKKVRWIALQLILKYPSAM